MESQTGLALGYEVGTGGCQAALYFVARAHERRVERLDGTGGRQAAIYFVGIAGWAGAGLRAVFGAGGTSWIC